jgi:hypothetical protein
MSIKYKTNILIMITMVLTIVALLLLSSCETIKHYTNVVIKDPSVLVIADPSEEDVKKHFIEACTGSDIEILQKIANIDFEITNRVEKKTIYDVYCWSDIEYWEDGPSYRIGEWQCYKGFVRFNKEEKGWSLPNNFVQCHSCSICHNCRHRF